MNSTETAALKVFLKALARCQSKIAAGSSPMDTLRSVERQLEYLIQVVSDPGADRSRLGDIILALYGVREFESDDPEFAELLSESDNFARILRSGQWAPTR